MLKVRLSPMWRNKRVHLHTWALFPNSTLLKYSTVSLYSHLLKFAHIYLHLLTSGSIYIREHFSPTLLYESTQRSHVYSLYPYLLKFAHIYLHLPICQRWALSSPLTRILPHLLTSVHAYSNIPRSVHSFFLYYELSPSTSLTLDETTKKNKKTNYRTIPSSLQIICIKWTKYCCTQLPFEQIVTLDDPDQLQNFWSTGLGLSYHTVLSRRSHHSQQTYTLYKKCPTKPTILSAPSLFIWSKQIIVLYSLLCKKAGSLKRSGSFTKKYFVRDCDPIFATSQPILMIQINCK